MASTSFYLIPIFGLAAAGAFGERLQAIQWAGAIVVLLALAGIALGTIRAAEAGGSPREGPVRA